jgi:hypothetical protein
MDPITTAIVAALTIGATSGITDTAKTMISDAYQGLKGVLHKKFGRDSSLVKSVEVLEAKPEAVGRQQTLDEEIIDAHANQDQDILQAAQHLLNLVQTQQGGERHILHVIGNYNAIVQGSGNATVNVNTSNQS